MTYFIVTYCFNSRTIQVNWALLNLPVQFDFSSPVDWFLLLFPALTRTSQPSRHFVHRMPRRASVFCVSPPGIHISLPFSDMCVGIHISRGYTYHCDTGPKKSVATLQGHLKKSYTTTLLVSRTTAIAGGAWRTFQTSLNPCFFENALF